MQNLHGEAAASLLAPNDDSKPHLLALTCRILTVSVQHDDGKMIEWRAPFKVPWHLPSSSFIALCPCPCGDTPSGAE